MALSDGAKFAVFVNGNALNWLTSVEHITNSGQQRIDTLEGLAGFTPGSGDCEVNLGYAIPISGTEEEFQQKCAAGEFCVVQVGVGPYAYVGTGKFLTNTMSGSAGANSEGTVNFLGELAPME